MKTVLKAPGTRRLKLNYDGLVSSFAFNFDLRRYCKGTGGVRCSSAPQLYVDEMLYRAKTGNVEAGGILRPSTRSTLNLLLLLRASV